MQTRTPSTQIHATSTQHPRNIHAQPRTRALREGVHVARTCIHMCTSHDDCAQLLEPVQHYNPHSTTSTLLFSGALLPRSRSRSRSRLGGVAPCPLDPSPPTHSSPP